jgi:hypothetical protein
MVHIWVIPQRLLEGMLRRLHDSDVGDFLCISDPLKEDGERLVRVAREEEYQATISEGREPAGDASPSDAMLAVEEQSSTSSTRKGWAQALILGF